MVILDDLKAKQRLYSQYGQRCNLLRSSLADGTLAVILYRIQQRLVQWRLSPVAFAVHLLNKWMHGCVIGLKANFGRGFVLIHPVGVVINSAVVGGDNVWIESGVVIGDNRGGVPVVGNDVFFGSGAKIVGALRVGSGCRIGANAVVMKDVPDGETWVGVPARRVGGI